jgi:hypothetical protein
MDQHGITHSLCVEVGGPIGLSDRLSGQTIEGLAWFRCDSVSSEPTPLLRYPTGVVLVGCLVDCMSCLVEEAKRLR